MGNVQYTLPFESSSWGHQRHVVHCFIVHLALQQKHSEFTMFKHMDVSVDSVFVDIIMGYVVYNDFFKFKTTDIIQYDDNKMTVTNTSQKDNVNTYVFGQYIIHCSHKENWNKAFKWVFNIGQCHFIEIGLVEIQPNMNYIDPLPFYKNKDLMTYTHTLSFESGFTDVEMEFQIRENWTKLTKKKDAEMHEGVLTIYNRQTMGTNRVTIENDIKITKDKKFSMAVCLGTNSKISLAAFSCTI